MNIYKNITIVGTSHISPESMVEVEKTILKISPDIVAVELDLPRLKSLSSSNQNFSLKNINQIGLKGFLFALIGHWIQKKLGEIVKVKPGSEMLKAVETARKTNSQIALIDRDVRITLKRFSKKITLKEKLRFVLDLFRGFFTKQKIRLDLRKVPEQKLIETMIKKLEERYPNVHQVLIEERNSIMARRIYRFLREGKTVVAVVGAGHKKEIGRLIKKLDKEN